MNTHAAASDLHNQIDKIAKKHTLTMRCDNFLLSTGLADLTGTMTVTACNCLSRLLLTSYASGLPQGYS